MDRLRDRLQKNPQDAQAWVDYGNLLWGEGRPQLSRIAYERALALDPGSVAALNNKGVVIASGAGEEDWYRVNEAQELFKRALDKDPAFLAALMNRGALFNYYRIFDPAKTLWTQVNSRVQVGDGHEGLAIALQGLGSQSGADAEFARATELGLTAKRWTRLYHQASEAFEAGQGGGPSKCITYLSDADETSLGGFERDSNENLKRTCKKWKND